MPLLALLLAACDRPPAEGAPPAPVPPAPRHAKVEMVEGLLADRAAARHPADGGGRAWLEEGGPATAGRPGSWTVAYEAGTLGIAEGGAIYLLVSPFWGWDTPQVRYPDGPGYTAVSGPDGLGLEAETLDANLLGVRVRGRAMRAGEQVRLAYGAGTAGARADRFAEPKSRLWVAVDGDGDGVRQVLADSPSVEVRPGPPAGLWVTLPSTARPGNEIAVTVAFLDRMANGGLPVEAEVALDAPGLSLPATLRFRPEDRGSRTVVGKAGAPGIVRVRAEAPGDLSGESNPLFISSDAPRVLWGDLHGHSELSDGSGSPEAYYRYARDVAALDFAALTDHDHWGMLFLDQHAPFWEEIRSATREAHVPGRFVTLLGYEWTSWTWGHRHVLYFGDEGKVFGSLDTATSTPEGLWAALRGQPAMTLAHHSAGGPIATDWSIPPDPVLEPLTEVASVHGQSEAPDAPGAIYSPVDGNFVRDALDLGYRFGFVGSGDTHDGHPGLAHLGGPSGGVAAVIGAELTREGLREALVRRRVYATNGPRIVLFTSLGMAPMGSDVAPGEADLVVFAVATAPIEGVDVVRRRLGVTRLAAEGETFRATLRQQDLRPGDYLYVRVVEEGGGIAWSSPFYVRGD